MAKAVRDRFKNLFSPLKDLDDHLQFVFITGISKFSQMGVFSTINQLNNISMQPAYESICGITEEELTTQMRPDIEWLAAQRNVSSADILSELKRMYDGYHFSDDMYVLGFPNYEVRTGFADCLYQLASGTKPDDDRRNVFLDAYVS